MSSDDMNLRKAAEMALETLEWINRVNAMDYEYQSKAQEPIQLLRQALAQPEQEPVDVVKVEHARRVELAEMYERGWNAALAKRKPVAWMYVNNDGECEQIEYGEPFDDPSVTPLYTAPPKREWVGLTDEELMALCDEWQIMYGGYVRPFAETIEAKLKEKNGG